MLRTKNLLELRKELQQYFRSSLEVGFSGDTQLKLPANTDAQKDNRSQSIPLANSLDNTFVIKVRKAIEIDLDDATFDVEIAAVL
mgnify:FL=1